MLNVRTVCVIILDRRLTAHDIHQLATLRMTCTRLLTNGQIKSTAEMS